MRKIEFSKYHGLGNDFIIVDLIGKRSLTLDFNRLALKICERHRGVGADGLLVLTDSGNADCTMDVFNADGSWAEKCGNGLRCVATYLYQTHTRKKRLTIETAGEIGDARIMKTGKRNTEVRVAVGTPEFRTSKIPMRSGHEYHINQPLNIGGVALPVTALAVGNPHCVLFVDNFDFDWQTMGSDIEVDPAFPHRTNVEFVKIVNGKKIILNDWERGAGATGSSGTGASAAVVAGVVNGLLDRQVEVVFPSGSLHIDWSETNDGIYLTGPAEYVFGGLYDFDNT
ncbi:MAG: diaminopimelate epimerase [candidate division Zixibacteria bacterium]|nr:diaminopimelate epimerase [candidate division Zixibacteria bacterium]